MTYGKTIADVEGRLEQVRLAMRQHHARVEPDERFADRVVARIPRDADWSFEWAVRRILPISIALAVVMTIVVLAIGGSTNGATSSASASVSATSQTGSDPLEWLLEGRQEVR
jgi:hypothetical protein